ncbi:helix-turn-helix domain-containing protein [Streptomyces lincolnensis]|uniref:helix-turn-helix domain-containing protein n=1 Tax=Streptomyces lincolnensis TaxID=1915 RepID=UPI001E4FDA34|nr:helix-turn-helix domain-containing protein [Streptomyces lincolnensis]MCD7440286.1 helix-turn-helix domain-containing protein [Streptomyces lincolnensis]
MSTEAVSWAMDDAPMLRTEKNRPDSTARHVLQVLGEHARPDGSNAHPSNLRIQYRTGYDERTVQRALRRLEAGGLIRKQGTVNGRTKWKLQMHLRRPEFDWAELEAEAEDAKKQAAERQRRARAKRVTHSEPVTVTHGESVTVTHSDDVTERGVTHSESVSHALPMRDVTHSASERHALSAPLTTSQPSENHQQPLAGPADASGATATPTPGDTGDAQDEVLKGEPVDDALAADSDAPITAQTIVGEWLERCTERPPSRVIGHLSKEIRILLDEDRIHPDWIRRGIATWMTKGLHPSTLASVVNEVMNSSAAPRQSAGPGYDPTTGTDLFDRAMARAKARDEAAAAAAEGGTP